MNRICLSVLLLSLGGCASLSGYDGQSSFSCKAPDGVTCSSLSGVYANATQNNLPGLQAKKAESNKTAIQEETADTGSALAAMPGDQRTGIIGQPLNSGDPIHAPSKILRVWIAPWEDEDGDLHDQSYVYMLADYGRWIIEHNRRRIMNEYQPTNLTTGSIARDSHESNPVKPGTAGSYNQQYANPLPLPEGSNTRQSTSPQSPHDNLDDLEDSF